MPFGIQLDAAIAAEEARLAELDRLTEAARGRLAEPHAAHERTTQQVDDQHALGPGVMWSAERKVALFAGLFRGREDVFPLRWENKAKGRSGLHRSHPGKHEALVYDYADAELPVLRRMFARRLKTYHALGYTLAEAQDGSTRSTRLAVGKPDLDTIVV